MSWLTGKDTPEDVLQSFVNLRRDPNFNRIIEWFKNAQAEEREAFDTIVDMNLYWCQGRSQALKKIINTNEHAETMLSQLRKPRA